MIERLYVCDGEVPGCGKENCFYAGTGPCRHTTDESHAMYEGPREWEVLSSAVKTTLFEKVRR